AFPKCNLPERFLNARLILGCNVAPSSSFSLTQQENEMFKMNWRSISSFTRRLIPCTVVAAITGSSVFALADPFIPGDLIVTRSVYTGTASTVTIGQTLPPVCGTQATCNGKATDNGQFANLLNSNNVWNNEKVDSSFGITSPIFLDQLT